MRPGSTLLPFVIPKWKWKCITYDFIFGLPKLRNHRDAIWVIVDRLTKSANFIPIRMDFYLEKIGKVVYLKDCEVSRSAQGDSV